MSHTATAQPTAAQAKFIAGDWGHLFQGDNAERMTRILVDAANHKLIRMDVQSNRAINDSYREASREELDDVQDSLVNGNPEVFDSPEDYGLLGMDTLPDWVTGGFLPGQIVFSKTDPAKFGPIKIESVDDKIVGFAKVRCESLPFHPTELYSAAALAQELEALIFGSGKIEYRRKQIGARLSVLQSAAELAAE